MLRLKFSRGIYFLHTRNLLVCVNSISNLFAKHFQTTCVYARLRMTHVVTSKGNVA